MDRVNSISGWGNYPKQRKAIFFALEEELPNKLTIRGNGRSYGDAAIGKNILSTLSLKNDISFDSETEILTCSSGVLLRDILNYCIPLGYTVPVIPGTQFATLGGMIAADIHGKNHFKNGSIGNWVKELLLEINPTDKIKCSETENAELFSATIGGMGLTGLILTVKLKLIPIKSCLYHQKALAVNSLKELIVCFETSNADYQVAWIDLLNNQPRFLHFSGNESNLKLDSSFQLKQPKLTIPKSYFSILSPFITKLYNRNYYQKAKKKKMQTISFDEFFFPLDKFNNWNNLYGTKGMIQYQFILPKENASERLNEIITMIKASTYKPYLSVLKKYKKNTSQGLLSFPIEGYSLALDFPYKKGLTSFLNQIDKKIIKFNGRIYLAKDACLEAKSIDEMYPNLDKFKHIVGQTKYSSNLAERLKIK